MSPETISPNTPLRMVRGAASKMIRAAAIRFALRICFVSPRLLRRWPRTIEPMPE